MSNLRNKYYGVLSGDILKSSKLSLKERKHLSKNLNSAFNLLKKYFNDSISGRIDLYSGDRWQMLISNPAQSLRIALAFKMILKSGALFKSINSRVSLAVGTVDFINKNKLSESDGEAFRISGRNLDDMNGHLSVSLPAQLQSDGIDLAAGLLDFILSKNTPKQSLALFGALAGMNQSQISRLWKPAVTQQSISLHLNNAGWHQIKKSVEYVENKLKDL